MIVDTLSNGNRYIGLHKRFARAFEYIAQQDLNKLEPGKYPVDGTDIHVSVSLKDGYKSADAKFEAHNNYIDIQVCIAGTEQLGWKPRNTCVQPVADYNAEKDVIFYSDRPDMYFQMKPGQFAIFFPEDVHAPMIGEGPIKKLVIKVKL
jgi:YhcH/YjgK/YiaL family protein